MKQIKKSIFQLMLFSFISLYHSLMPMDKGAAAVAEQAADELLLQHQLGRMLIDPRFTPVREHFTTIGQCFDSMQEALRNPIAQPEALTETMRQMEAAFAQVSAFAANQLHAHQPALDERERATMQALHSQAQKASLVDAVVGGGGASILFWLHQLEPVQTVRLATRAFRTTRMTGLEVPAALGTLGAIGAACKVAFGIIKPLLGPIGMLIFIGWAWHKIKQSIIRPYQERHQHDLAQMRAQQAVVEAQIGQKFEQAVERVRTEAVQAR